MCPECFSKTPKAKEEKNDEEAAKKAQEAKITEAFDDMVKYMEEKLKGMAPEKIAEFGSIVKTKLLNEKITPSIVAKEIRGLKIAEAAVRAERDKAMELIDELEVGKTTIEESKKVENSILVKKLKEATADVDSVSKLLEEKKKEVNKLSKQITEVKVSSEKEIKKIYEQSKAEVEETKQNLSESSGKKILESYVGMKLSQSGLKVSANARALLEKCTTIESVNDTLEDLKDAMRKDALRPGKIDSIKIEETKQKVSEAKTLTTAVQTLMGSMR
jgi:hypothetical protein